MPNITREGETELPGVNEIKRLALKANRIGFAETWPSWNGRKLLELRLKAFEYVGCVDT